MTIPGPDTIRMRRASPASAVRSCSSDMRLISQVSSQAMAK